MTYNFEDEDPGGTDNLIICPKCGGDEIKFDPPFTFEAKREDVECICEKCGKRFEMPRKWWAYMIEGEE